ncbi:hypothetical protein A374_15424 [Fictibacillus macauensis ZFHKF-1]|uniref:DUF58 domain-containing protein n=1 Tax=Fictibacillus macauensis ZFHKF-1 TaxID=1196324 RepID=I8UCC8_9BACL|nr:DUF58 domain-containing protein [Fictibacillus macauensis]EIT84438.1 hypothetical protein A374_15424 [Fictibacillus macauensis ZFHKF-1]
MKKVARKLRLFLFITSCACSFLYAIILGGFISWFLFYALLFCLTYVLLLRILPLQGMEIERSLSKDRIMAGEEVTIKLTISRHSLFPILYFIIEDLLPPSLSRSIVETGKDAQVSGKVIYFPFFQRTFSYEFRVKPVPRGIFEWDTLRVTTGDLFGLYQKSRTILCKSSLFVYPAYQTIEHSELAHSLQSGTKRSSRRSSTTESLTVSVRDYVPGDRLSWLHWKATARSNKLVTKVFEQQLNEDLVLWIDQSTASYKANEALFERVISFAASYALYTIQKGSEAVLYEEKPSLRAQSHSGFQQKWDMLHKLAGLSLKKESWERAFEGLEMERSFDGKKLILFTPILNEAFVASVKRLRIQHGDLYVFYFPNDSELSKQEQTWLHRLRHQEIPALAVTHDHFQRVLKAGGQRAGS